MSSRVIVCLLGSLLLPSVALAQTPGGTVGNAEADYFMVDYPDLPTSSVFSNWYWLDQAGVRHDFSGATHRTYKYTYYVDMAPRYRGYVDSSLTSTAADGSCVLYAQGPNGSINSPVGAMWPKYAVLGVIYSPPGGSRSTVTYEKANNLGTSHTVGHSFSNSLGITFGFGANVGLAGATSTLGFDWTISKTSSNTVSITHTQTAGTTINGSDNGINHDNDQIILWLNPSWSIQMANLQNITPTVNGWSGVNSSYATYENALGQNFPPTEMNVITVTVGELRSGNLLRGNLEAFQRAFDTSVWPVVNGAPSGPAITPPEYADILAANPFYSSGTTLDSNGHIVGVPSISALNSAYPASNPRFVFVQTMDFVPNQTNYGKDTNSYTDSNTQSGSETFAVSWSHDASWNFIFKAGVKYTDKASWTSSYGTTVTSGSAVTTSFNLAGPQSTPVAPWIGPTKVAVYRDNLYGSYVFLYVAP